MMSINLKNKNVYIMDTEEYDRLIRICRILITQKMTPTEETIVAVSISDEGECYTLLMYYNVENGCKIYNIVNAHKDLIDDFNIPFDKYNGEVLFIIPK